VSGITQGLMWRAFDEAGRLMYPEFIETVTQVVPMYWVRLIGGLLYLGGVVMLMVNAWMTIRSAPKELPDPAYAAPVAPVHSGGDGRPGAAPASGDGTEERKDDLVEVAPSESADASAAAGSDAPGTKKPAGPGTKKPDGPGTKKPDGPGTKKPDGPGTKKPEGPGTKNAQGPGTKKPDGPPSLRETDDED
jgi:hypothetical protein